MSCLSRLHESCCEKERPGADRRPGSPLHTRIADLVGSIGSGAQVHSDVHKKFMMAAWLMPYRFLDSNDPDDDGETKTQHSGVCHAASLRCLSKFVGF